MHFIANITKLSSYLSTQDWTTLGGTPVYWLTGLQSLIVVQIGGRQTHAADKDHFQKHKN